MNKNCVVCGEEKEDEKKLCCDCASDEEIAFKCEADDCISVDTYDGLLLVKEYGKPVNLEEDIYGRHSGTFCKDCSDNKKEEFDNSNDLSTMFPNADSDDEDYDYGEELENEFND